jgi:hypothetical protein
VPEDSEEYQRQQEQQIGNAIRMAALTGGRSSGTPAMVSIASNPAANLAPDAQRNEALVRSAGVRSLTPAPELLFIYGIFAMLVTAYAAIASNPLGIAFFVAGILSFLTYPVTRFLPLPMSRDYILAVASTNAVLLVTALYVGASGLPADWWPTLVEAFSLYGFAAYPVVVLRRKWKQVK